MAVMIFLCFVAVLLGLSFYLSSRARSASGYFVADGKIHWAINGIALTGGYLSAASFLGICGMIAFRGFDGYLYSIGFLSGWVVALFVVAEPMRRLGRYTLADALAAKFDNKGIHLAAGVSTLVISLCYLVPQMVGAGVLMEPLVGVPYHWGVVSVGSLVIIIVATAGMTSTTYVQFLKAGLLIIFCTVLVAVTCWRGLDTSPPPRDTRGEIMPPREFGTIGVLREEAGVLVLDAAGSGYTHEKSVREAGSQGNEWVLLSRHEPITIGPDGSCSYIRGGVPVRFSEDSRLMSNLQAEDRSVNPDIGDDGQSPSSVMVNGVNCVLVDGVAHAQVKSWWRMETRADGTTVLREAQHQAEPKAAPAGGDVPDARVGGDLYAMGRIARLPANTPEGPVGPIRLLSVFASPDTEIEVPRTAVVEDDGHPITLYYHETMKGNEFMRPGGHYDLASDSIWPRLDFISLMLALFFGTVALPHVLIRYYTVPDSTAARKSTIVAIAAIGFFYILTLYLGLGAIVNGVLNPQTTNMTAPLLARSFGEVLFAIISSIAFATVLGTVAGLIVAAAGAVANDLADRAFGLSKSERGKVLVAKAASALVGIVAIVLGILLRDMNVGFLVGWAFAVAASANLPSILMVLFWKRTTAHGIIASILVGIFCSMAIILMGPDMFELYGFQRHEAWIPLGQPGIVSIPASFLTIVVVSLLTSDKPSPPLVPIAHG
jgi:cation/acetate symporter